MALILCVCLHAVFCLRQGQDDLWLWQVDCAGQTVEAVEDWRPSCAHLLADDQDDWFAGGELLFSLCWNACSGGTAFIFHPLFFYAVQRMICLIPHRSLPRKMPWIAMNCCLHAAEQFSVHVSAVKIKRAVLYAWIKIKKTVIQPVPSKLCLAMEQVFFSPCIMFDLAIEWTVIVLCCLLARCPAGVHHLPEVQVHAVGWILEDCRSTWHGCWLPGARRHLCLSAQYACWWSWH